MLLAAALPEIEVFVGINREYVTLIDPAKHELLLVQPLFDCSWRRVDVEPSNGQSQHRSLSSETENLPCFLLHFPDDSESVDRTANINSEQVEAPEKSKLLQVFSRQAVMMEALMTALYTIGIFEAKEFTDVEDELVDFEDIDAEEVDNRDNDEFEDMKEVRDIESPKSTSTAEVEDMPQELRSNGGQPRHNGEQKTLRERQPRSSTTRFRSGSPQKQDRNGGHSGKTYRTYSPTFSPTMFASNFSKLCLATFDASGKCVDAQGSLRRVLQEA
ncbi:unnamed protein product [Toxocara canis]|nr:unnamed protein product [Toxocara canis]